jgi:hypothetical protein
VWVWIAGTGLAATLERWWFPRAWDETLLPASRLYFGDTPAFLRYAAAFSAGASFDNGIPFHPPGWPFALSIVFRLFDWSIASPADLLLLKHVQAVISGASVGLAALLASIVAGRGAMVVTSLLGIFHFGHLVQASAPNSEPLYGLLMILVLLGVTRTTTGGGAFWIGGLAGLTTLVRAEFGVCAPLVAVWIAFDRTGERGKRSAVLFVLGALLALTPTTAMNWRNIDAFNRTRSDRLPGPLPRFAPVTSYGAFNFANANHERADGGFNWNLPSLAPDTAEAAADLEAAQLDLARPAVYRAYVDGYWMGATWLVSHPASAVRLVLAKLAITLSVFDYGYLLDNVPVPLHGIRRPVDQIDLGLSWVTLVHASLALGGLWIAVQGARTRLLLAPILTLLASSLLFFGYVRLGVAYLPVFWILQALAVTRVLGLVSWRPIPSPRRVEWAVAALVAVLLVSERSAADRSRVLMVDGLADESGRLVEDQPMDIERVR